MELELKYIPGYEGLYSATTEGYIFSHIQNKFLKKCICQGYNMVSLYKNGKQNTKKCSRLVGFTFVEKVDNKNIINHKNGIKHDDRVENLEWCTISENIQHAHDNGLWKSTKKHKDSARLQGLKSGKKVMQFSKEGVLLKVYNSTREASRFTEFSQPTIYRYVSGITKCKEYNWQYANS